jgi:ABC-type branched-subunit amino acid transport system ATPase component
LTAPALELEELSSGYGESLVVRGVSLRVRAGEIVALLGKNGMGKSTLLRSIMGYLRLRGGSVRLLGEDVGREPVHRRARRGIAYVPQEKALFQDLSIRDNLRLALADDAMFEAGLLRIGSVFPVLADRLAQPAGTLSGGEQKMLLTARAIMADPKVMLVDEVTEGLQPSVVDRLANVLRGERDRGRAILLVEQHVGFVRRVADRFAVLKLGEVVAEGTTGDRNAEALIEQHLQV